MPQAAAVAVAVVAAVAAKQHISKATAWCLVYKA